MPDLVLKRSGPNGGGIVHDRDAQVVATNAIEDRSCKAEGHARPADEEVARGSTREVAGGNQLAVLVGAGDEGRRARWDVQCFPGVSRHAAMPKKLETGLFNTPIYCLYFEVLRTMISIPGVV